MRHGLKEDQAETLFLAREGEEAAVAEFAGETAVIDVAEKFDGGRQAELVTQGLQAGEIVAAADNAEGGIRDRGADRCPDRGRRT